MGSSVVYSLKCFCTCRRAERLLHHDTGAYLPACRGAVAVIADVSLSGRNLEVRSSAPVCVPAAHRRQHELYSCVA